jgi:drug/metabolite transporter (DMT)-like permease
VSWAVFVFMGLFTTYGAYMCYCAGLRRLDPTRVAVTANLEPVTAAAMAWLWWGEVFAPVGYLGGALVLAGVVVMVLEGKRVRRAPVAGV